MIPKCHGSGNWGFHSRVQMPTDMNMQPLRQEKKLHEDAWRASHELSLTAVGKSDDRYKLPP